MRLTNTSARLLRQVCRPSYAAWCLFLLPLSANADQRGCEAATTQTVYFGNGIWAESEQQVATGSLLDLKNGLQQQMSAQDFSNTCFQVAFNRSVSKIGDLLETAAQILGDAAPTLLVGELLGVGSFPTQQLLDLLLQQTAQQLASPVITDTDVYTQIAQYKLDVTNHRKIVVVAHSQGNLFVNKAFKGLSQTEQASFAMMPVASPDSEALKSLVGHVTFLNDYVIAGVQAARLLLGLPPALVPDDFDDGAKPWYAHDFSLNYLTDVSARKFIIDGVVSSLAVLPVAPTCSLTASPGFINPGQSSVLSWATTGIPASSTIDSGIGGVNPSGSGSITISPTAWTAYTMTVTNAAGSGTCVGFIFVYLPPRAGFVMSAAGVPPVTDSQTLNLTVPTGGSVSVSFDGSSPRSFDPDGAVAAWQWSVGGVAASSNATFSRSFTLGTYTVSLVVTDNQGLHSTAATGTIVVSAAGSPMFTIKDLGTLGGTNSLGRAINNSGQVAGYSNISGDQGDVTVNAFRWDGAVMQPLISLGPVTENYEIVPQGYGLAYGINDAGQVVGASYTTTNIHAVVWTGVIVQDLGTGWGNYSYAMSINSAGQVAGFIGDSVAGGERPAIWNGTTVTDLGTPGGNCEATSINNKGQVAVGCTTYCGFVWNGSVMRDIGDLGGGGTTVLSINDSGQITGRSGTPGPNGTDHAYIWQDGIGMKDIQMLLAPLPFPFNQFINSSQGQGINKLGQVTGTLTNSYAGQHAFYFDGGTMWDLNNQLVNGTGWVLTFGASINDAGQITGYGTNGGGTHAFLLTPVVQ